MFEIWDEQTGALLDGGLVDFDQARARLEELLAQARVQVEASGDGVAGMVLEWEIRDAATGEGVGWHWGAPVAMPGHR